jgi:hypothetical protein
LGIVLLPVVERDRICVILKSELKTNEGKTIIKTNSDLAYQERHQAK